MYGGPSQVDLFDPKPSLDRQERPDDRHRDAARAIVSKGTLLGSPRTFAKHGESGIEVSDLFPTPGPVRRRHGDRPVDATPTASTHGSALLPDEHRLAPPGQAQPGELGRPTAWGPRTRTCPAFVVLPDPRGGPIGGAAELGRRASCPPRYQGTQFRTRATRSSTSPPARPSPPRASSATSSTSSAELNADAPRARPRRVRAGRPDRSLRAGLPDAGARPRGRRPRRAESAETQGALRPRTSARIRRVRPQVPAGPPPRRARRAVRAGLLAAAVTTTELGRPRRRRQEPRARTAARPTSRSPACSTDLKRRGLLDETLVVWGGEFGRMPISRGRQGPRPQPPGLHRLAGRRRRQGGHGPSARPTRSATPRSRTRSTSTTSTPRSSTCSASTTPSSPTSTTAATSA